MKSKSNEFDNFDRTMRKLLTVSHDEIKQKLETEKLTKKKRKAKTPSASRASTDKD